MTEQNETHEEDKSPSIEPRFDFNHSVILNTNDNKFTITAVEKISKDEFKAILDVKYLQLRHLFVIFF